MNPLVEKYLKEKYGETYQQDAETELADRDSQANLGQLFANIGDAVGGQKVGSQNSYFDALKKGNRADTVGKIEGARKSYMEDQEIESKTRKNQRDAERYDPNSGRSKAFRNSIASNFPEIAKTYGPDFENITAGDEDAVFKPLQLKEQQRARIEAARAAAGQREDARTAKREEKEFALQTPYGLANTPDDAKQLKEGHESKKNFDSKLRQMIELRQSKGGGDALDRDAVARGKQLSKDLLLEYKNMAKLGVLSANDEAIINAIIPEDPLQFRSPYEALAGQDSVLTKLKGFQSDSDQDFKNRVQTRTRSGVKTAAERKPIREERNKKTGQVRVVFDDGSFEIKPSLAEK